MVNNVSKITSILKLFVIILTCGLANAEPSTYTQTNLAKMQALKVQLYNDLNNGDIESATFDDQTELEIANTQMQIAEYYLAQGDRKNAVINAIIARKILQKVYANPNSPELIPVYSLLVQIYTSSVDIDAPQTDASDAAKAKLYRQAIDHIHSE